MKGDSRTPERGDGRERLLAAAVRHLETEGEASLRLADLAAEAQVAIGLIRHHFGGRDGLIAEAQRQRLTGAAREDLAGVRAALEATTDTASLLASLATLTRSVSDRSRTDVRRSRLAAMAAVHGRPDAADEFGAVLGALLDELATLVTLAQGRGLVRTDLDPRAIATFIQACALGLIIHDLDPRRDDDALTEVIAAALHGVLVHED